MRWNKSQRNNLTIEPGRSRDISRDKPYKSDPYLCIFVCIFEPGIWALEDLQKNLESPQSISKFSPVCV